MAIIAITGRKGGCGKSTITANLAGELAAAGRRIAVLDVDPQQSLCAWASLGAGILSKIVSAVDAGRPDVFRAAVEAAARSADRVLIDTPPGFTDPALLADLVADIVLLPAGPSPLDILAARDALALTRQARAQRGGRKPIVRFVPARVTRSNLGRDLHASLAGMGEKVLPGISQRVAIAEAAVAGLTIGEYSPGSPAHVEFQALAKALEGLLR
jgi:chromosome partitioning protein